MSIYLLLAIVCFLWVISGIIAYRTDNKIAKWVFVTCLALVFLFILVNIAFAWIINPIRDYFLIK